MGLMCSLDKKNIKHKRKICINIRIYYTMIAVIIVEILLSSIEDIFTICLKEIDAF